MQQSRQTCFAAMADGGLPEGMTAGTVHQISPQQNNTTAAVLDAFTPLNVMSFNLERGYDVGGLTSFISAQGADVLLLQELDWGCKRTNGAAVVRELSDRLGMHALFVVEFEELDDPRRSARKAGGGVHGNAILSRLPITAHGMRVHSTQFDWEAEGLKDGEPRRGQRVLLWADVRVWPDMTVRCCSVHLENKCGAIGRVQQFSEVLGEVYRDAPECVVIGGDMNTLMHGVVRWDVLTQPGDRLRFATFGESEAEWWHRLVFNGRAEPGCERELYRVVPEAAELRSHLDRALELTDPFHPQRDLTLDHTAGWVLWARSFLFNGKLDWLLHSHETLACTAHKVVPSGLSDHSCLVCELTLRPR